MIVGLRGVPFCSCFLFRSLSLLLRADHFSVSPSAGLPFLAREKEAKARLRPAGLKNLGVRDFLYAVSVVALRRRS